MIIYKEIESCRICKNQELDLILDLGTLPLTGVFPQAKSEEVPTGPLSLVKCRESNSNESCGLVQLRESYNPELMYGKNYGYRSGLNKSMVQHLHDKVKNILESCRKSLSSYKIPRLIRFVDNIPKTQYGKIDRKKNIKES